MNPRIDGTSFGSITIEGTAYTHDVVIRSNGKVRKRKKSLSRAIDNTCHTLSLVEVRHIYDKGAERLIIGTGQFGLTDLSREAADYLKRKRCEPELLPTRKAARAWNKTKGAVIGLFHITC